MLPDLTATIAFLAARAVPGVEHANEGTYRRTLRLPHGHAVLELRPPGPRILVTDPRDRVSAETACRRLLGSDETARAADAHLAADPHLATLVAARPGLRVPGTVDGGEIAIRAVLGQQVTLAAARNLAGRLVTLAGDRAPDDGALAYLWPRPGAIAAVAAEMPMPRSRQVALAAVAEALAAGALRLEPGPDRDETRRRLLELPGIGPWTAEYVAMRALGDPDAWLPTDAGVRHGLLRLGVSAETSEAWRPFRAHAVAHLWASG